MKFNHRYIDLTRINNIIGKEMVDYQIKCMVGLSFIRGKGHTVKYHGVLIVAYFEQSK
jgi:hypothetical protein